MRILVWSMVATLACLVPAYGQNQNPATFFGGVDPADVKFKPIDTSHPVAPVPNAPSRITLSGILAKLNIPGLYKSTPLFPVPKPGESPSAALYPSLLYKNVFQPVQPIPPR